jgi:hypothetical protein
MKRNQAGGEGDEDREDAEDSSEGLRERRNVMITPEEQDALIKEVWGNLPPHVRQQMSGSSVEGFLPKYEQLTQEYFRRLAEMKE